MSNVKIPSDGAKITINKDGTYDIPDNPIITFIEGDGIGPDLWRASVRVFDAAVEKTFKGSNNICLEILKPPEHVILFSKSVKIIFW